MSTEKGQKIFKTKVGVPHALNTVTKLGQTEQSSNNSFGAPPPSATKFVSTRYKALLASDPHPLFPHAVLPVPHGGEGRCTHAGGWGGRARVKKKRVILSLRCEVGRQFWGVGTHGSVACYASCVVVHDHHTFDGAVHMMNGAVLMNHEVNSPPLSFCCKA
jgi:hypothetical protein